MCMRLAAGVGILFLVVTFTPVDNWMGGKLSGRWNQPSGDTLVILAGDSGANGVIGYGTYLRVQYAVMAYEAHPFRRIVVTGSGSPDPQAPLMRQFLVCQGVPADKILVDETSTSTRENALHTKALLAPDIGTLDLLTSDYHMYRASRTFTKVGLRVTTIPIPDARKRGERWAERWPAFCGLMQELAKIGYYRVKGWI